jgi:Na+/melibiose symporter-like transporter
MAPFSRTAADTRRMTEDYGIAKWVEREDAHARQVLSTAKLVVTFSLPIAAGFVSAALQKDDKAGWAITAVVLMAFALLLTLRVVVRKRGSDVDPSHLEGKPPNEVQAVLKSAAVADKKVAQSAHGLMVWQILLSSASAVAAVVELFS